MSPEFIGLLMVAALVYQMRRNLEDYMMVFDSNFAPIVGQQVTLTATNQSAASARVVGRLRKASSFPSAWTG